MTEAIRSVLARLFREAPDEPTISHGDAIEVRQAMLAALSALQLSAPRVRNDSVERTIFEAVDRVRDALDKLP